MNFYKSASNKLQQPLAGIFVRNYAKRVKNILRNKYPHRNPDGSYIEYNESVTIIPKEFEKQGLRINFFLNESKRFVFFF